MPKDNEQSGKTSQVRYVKLFVSSNCEACDQAAAFLRRWSDNHSEIKTEMVSVLSAPTEVIRLQIFYTPALVINDKPIVKRDLSVEEIAELLPA